MNYYQEELDLVYPRKIPLWSTVIENKEQINNQIIETIVQHRKDNPENYTDTINVNVWQSNWEMHSQPGIDTVAEASKKLTKTIAEEYYNFHTFVPDILDCWVNVYNKDSGCRVHQHFPATFSLVYYVQVPQNSGNIYFPDIKTSLAPEPGLLLCFRGDLWHGVQFNLTTNDRIIIGLNIIHKNS